MLKLKLTKEQYEALEESLQAFYTEKDGEFLLQIDGLEDTGALKRAKDREAQQRKDAEQRLKELEQQLEEIQGNDARKRGDIETLEKSWASKLEQREKELTDRINALTDNVTRSLVDNVASEIAHKISTAPKLILPHIKARLQADFEGDTPKTRVLDSNGQPSALTIDDLAKEFSASPDFANVIVGSKASGGNTPPASNPNFSGEPMSLAKASPEALVEYLNSKKQ